MPHVLDGVFFVTINHINMHLFLGICTTLVLNLGFVELEDSDILGSEYIFLLSGLEGMYSRLIDWMEQWVSGYRDDP